MKTLRQLHLYLGCFFAPLLVVFALTGIAQTYEAPRYYQWVNAVSPLEKTGAVLPLMGFLNEESCMGQAPTDRLRRWASRAGFLLRPAGSPGSVAQPVLRLKSSAISPGLRSADPDISWSHGALAVVRASTAAGALRLQ